MTMSRNAVSLILSLGLGLSMTPLGVDGQAAGKVHRIGILAPTEAYSGRVEAIRQGLRELGYVEGQNITIEIRYGKKEGELPDLAAELVRRNVEVIVTGGSAAIRPAMKATTAVPIVMMADNADPVEAGYVAS